MAIQVIRDTKPNAQGTVVVTVSPTDENGDPLVFAQLKNPQWAMRISGGETVPGCDYGDNTVSSLTWAITGDQLATFGDTDSGRRTLTFKAQYDSSAGSDLHTIARCFFELDKMEDPDEA